jgi:hypothetical protein
VKPEDKEEPEHVRTRDRTCPTNLSRIQLIGRISPGRDLAAEEEVWPRHVRLSLKFSLQIRYVQHF